MHRKKLSSVDISFTKKMRIWLKYHSVPLYSWQSNKNGNKQKTINVKVENLLPSLCGFSMILFFFFTSLSTMTYKMERKWVFDSSGMARSNKRNFLFNSKYTKRDENWKWMRGKRKEAFAFKLSTQQQRRLLDFRAIFSLTLYLYSGTNDNMNWIF